MTAHKKTISSTALFALASGTMISSGIFILPGLAYGQIGPLVILSYFLAGAVAFLSSLSLIELSTAMPKAGGDYFYITRSLGPGVGTVMGLLSWLALMLKTAFAVFGLAELGFVFFGFPPHLLAIGLALLFVVLNLIGTGEAITLEVILVFALLAIMLAYVILGFKGWDGENFRSGFSLFGSQENPLDGLRLLFQSSAFVFVSYGGLLNVTTLAEEVKNPGRAIPRAMILSVSVITVLYVAMVGMTTAILSPEEFSGSLTPIADSALIIMGRPGQLVIVFASALAFVTTGNAGVMAASRYPLALSRDGLLPEAISRSNRKGTPYVAILLTGLGIIIAVLIPLESLVKVASTVILITYIATNIAIIILRESSIRNYSPLFRIPLYPYVPVAALLLMGYFLIELGVSSLEILLLFSSTGLLIYLLYGRKRSRYEFAALHLIKNMVNRKLQDEGLEEELRDIIRGREQLSQDITDELLKKAYVLDIGHKETLHGVFQMAGSLLAPVTGMTSEEISRKLEERERMMSTALSPFISVPHILIPGTEEIWLCLIRCREGLFFDATHPDIKSMVILIGSEERREDHLKILTGLVHIFRHEEFREVWMDGKDMESIRDQLILLDRKRESSELI